MLCSPLGAYFTAHRSTCIAFSSNFLTSLYHMSLQKQHSALRKYTYIIHFQSLNFQYTMGSKKSETTRENAFFFSLHILSEKTFENKICMIQVWFKNHLELQNTWLSIQSLMTQIYLISDLETVFFISPSHFSFFKSCLKFSIFKNMNLNENR